MSVAATLVVASDEAVAAPLVGALDKAGTRPAATSASDGAGTSPAATPRSVVACPVTNFKGFSHYQ